VKAGTRMSEMVRCGHASQMPHAALKVWLLLAEHAAGDAATMSLGHLKNATGMSVNTVRTGLDWLVDHWYIDQQITGKSKAQKAVYYLLPLPKLLYQDLIQSEGTTISNPDTVTISKADTVDPPTISNTDTIPTIVNSLRDKSTNYRATPPEKKPDVGTPEVCQDDRDVHNQWLSLMRAWHVDETWHPTPPPRDPKPSDDALHFARLRTWGSAGSPVGYPNPDDRDKAPVTGQTVETIRDVLEWLVGDDFWKQHIKTPYLFTLRFGQLLDGLRTDRDKAASKNGGGPTCKTCGGKAQALTEHEQRFSGGKTYRCLGDCQTHKTTSEVLNGSD